MSKQFSSAHLLTAVLTVLLVVVVAGEVASAETSLGEKESLATFLTEGSAADCWVENDATQEQVFVKRVKKNTRVGKTLLRYKNTYHQKGISLALDKTGGHQYISSRHSELLIFYCVLQI
ncbi:MAG: hypothetical protein ACFB15_17050 [Cyclobacteriaceae bacterium]